MHRQRSAIDSFPEIIDIDEGSVSNNSGMSQHTSLNNMLNPVESRFSNNAVSSNETSRVNAVTHDVQSFSGWNSGESSSRVSSQNEVNDDGIKIEERWSCLVNHHTGVNSRSEERQFEPTNILFPGRVSVGVSGNHVRSPPLFLRGPSSSHIQLNSNPSAGYVSGGGNSFHGAGAVTGPNHFNSGGLEIEQASSSSVSSDDVGASSGNSGFMAEETNGGSGSSLGSWGLSCKRKAVEGTSGNSYPCGSSSYFPQPENGTWHCGPIHHNASGSLNLTASSQNSPVSPPEQLNPVVGFNMRGITSDAFPSSSASGNTDLSRSFGRRVNSGHQQESLPFNLSTGSSRRYNVWSQHQSHRSVPFSDSLNLRSTAAAAAAASTSTAQGQPHGSHTSTSSRSMHPFLWTVPSNSRAENPSSSLPPGARGAASREELNLRSTPRNSAEHLWLPEIRHMPQDPTGWSLSPGNMSTSGSIPPAGIGPSSHVHPLPVPAWISPIPTTRNQQRFSEFAPWSLFPSVQSESGGRNANYCPLSSGPSASSQDAVMSSGSSSQSHNQPFSRSAFLLEGQGDDVLGMPRSLRALAADIEGRHRLISEIRQVLSAMRRGESLRVEDYMLFDPFIYHDMAEVHDRHREMRLDVDNMSYEELLALEERIGDVSTGLSEETILKLIKQQKYMSIIAESPADLEPCCICQEEYADGDDLGALDCGHEFHTNCIKQWLMQKNLCPICKMTALPT